MLLLLRPNFVLRRLDFFQPPLTAPGSPRMHSYLSGFWQNALFMLSFLGNIVTVCDFSEIPNVCILTSFALSNSIHPEHSIDPILISDFHQCIQRRGSQHCVVGCIRTEFVTFPHEWDETFTRMKVAWTKNKRKFKRLHFPRCFALGELRSQSQWAKSHFPASKKGKSHSAPILPLLVRSMSASALF